MIWYSVEEEVPLDTLNRPSLWLWDGEKVIQGGFVEGSRAKKYKDGYWFDLNFQPFKGVHSWREIMPEDVVADEIQEEPTTAPKQEIINEDIIAEPPVPAVIELPKPAETPLKQTPEPAKSEPLTINQRMSAQLNKGGVTDQPAGQPVSDLKHAISLNDKLLYIKDLFNGYNLAYSEAIEILNRFSSFEDAERFLTKNYVAKNNWEGKADTAAKLYAVLKRRYM